jgi:hypothetical protein
MGWAEHFTADAILEPAGYRQIFPTTVQGVLIGDGRVALIQTLLQNVRVRDDGTDPTTTVGYVLFAGQPMWYTGDLRKLRFIEEASGAEVNLLAYK